MCINLTRVEAAALLSVLWQGVQDGQDKWGHEAGKGAQWEGPEAVKRGYKPPNCERQRSYAGPGQKEWKLSQASQVCRWLFR